MAQCRQSGQELRPVAADQHRPVVEGGPGGGQGESDIHRSSAGPGGDEVVQPCGLGPQRLVAPRGQNPGHRCGRGCSGHRRTVDTIRVVGDIIVGVAR